MASREEDKAIAGLLQKSLAAEARPRRAPAGRTVPRRKSSPPISIARSMRKKPRATICIFRNVRIAANNSPRWPAPAATLAVRTKSEPSAWNWVRTPAWLMPAAAAFALLV